MFLTFASAFRNSECVSLKMLSDKISSFNALGFVFRFGYLLNVVFINFNSF